MTPLKGLNPAARAALSDNFRRGLLETADIGEHVVDPGFGREVDLDPLREVLTAAMAKFGNNPRAASDPWLGPRVHSALRLTRREAADKRVWDYLNVVEFPDYVRWRWLQDQDKAVPLDRFIGDDNRNSLGRLWWNSELFRNGSDYTCVAEALHISQFFLWQGLLFAHHRPAALATVSFLRRYRDGLSNPQMQKMVKAVNTALRTRSLDMVAENSPTDAEAIREWVTGKVDATLLLRDELPAGPDETSVSQQAIADVRQFLEGLAKRIGLAGDDSMAASESK